MHDLKDISFMIHVRIDVQDRLDNLEIVMDYYHSNCENVEFIIVNDDAKPDKRLKFLSERYKSSKFLFQENSGMYHRTRAFNQASKQTDRPFIIAHDTDVIIHPHNLVECKEFMRKNPILGGVYPYNGLFIHPSDKHKQTIKETKSVDFLQDMITEFLNGREFNRDIFPPNYTNEDFLVAHNNSKGGSNMYNHENWKVFKGYNPGFVGWGSEDDEIFHRVTTMGYKFDRFDVPQAIAWHLPHHNTVRDLEPYCTNNSRLCVNIQNNIKTLAKMSEYIQSWEL